MTRNTFDREITIRNPTFLGKVNNSKPRKQHPICNPPSDFSLYFYKDGRFQRSKDMSVFQSGDKCYVLTLQYDYIPQFKCPMCNGTGANLYLQNTPCDCLIHNADGEPYECHNGSMSIRAKRWQVVEDVVESVCGAFYSATYGEIDERIYTRRHGYFSTKDVYRTLDEAKIMCEQFNKLHLPACSEGEFC